MVDTKDKERYNKKLITFSVKNKNKDITKKKVD